VADQIQTLLVSLEARIAGYEREMKRAVGIANRNANSIETRFKTMNRNISNTMNGVSRTIGAAFAGVAALQGAQSLIDASVRIENSLKVAGLAGEDLSQVYDSLRDSALRNAAPFESLVDLYGRVALVQKELGVSSEDLTGFADNVALALRVSGQSASEASGALLQLSQALGSGVVRAEEFNSILEGAPTILQAAAAGIVEAEGSVAKLRAIMLEGNLSSKALFDGFATGSTILEEKVAGSTLTVSQGFENLNTQLIDVARRFNESAGVSALLNDELKSLGQGVQDLAIFLENIVGPVQTFVGSIQTGIDKVQELSNAIAQITGLERIGFDAAITTNNLTGGVGLSANSSAAGRVLDQTFALVGETPQDETLAAIMAGKAEPEPLKIVVDGSNPISIKDPQYKPPASSGGKGGGSKQSPGEKFDDILKKQAEENRLLAEKTALQATLNPLVNDYGFAIEKLNVQQELQSAATAAGLELTPALKASIDELATGYANASVEAARLAESQDQLKQISNDFDEAGKSAIKGFISDLREGKSAADALSNAMNSVLDKVIDIGLNMLLGGFGGGGGGLFGGIGKLFGFAGGGYTGNGGRNEPAGVVHRGEYVFTKAQTARLGVGNLAALAKGYANGGYVGAPGPVAQGGGAIHITVGVSADSNGNLLPFVTEVADSRVAKAAPAIGGAAVRTSSKQAGPSAGEYNARFGTG